MLKNIKKGDEKGDNEHKVTPIMYYNILNNIYIKMVCYTIKGGERQSFVYKELSMSVGDLDKLVLDVQNGLYPISGPMTSTKVKHPVPPVNPDPIVVSHFSV